MRKAVANVFVQGYFLQPIWVLSIFVLVSAQLSASPCARLLSDHVSMKAWGPSQVTALQFTQDFHLTTAHPMNQQGRAHTILYSRGHFFLLESSTESGSTLGIAREMSVTLNGKPVSESLKIKKIVSAPLYGGNLTFLILSTKGELYYFSPVYSKGLELVRADEPIKEQVVTTFQGSKVEFDFDSAIDIADFDVVITPEQHYQIALVGKGEHVFRAEMIYWDGEDIGSLQEPANKLFQINKSELRVQNTLSASSARVVIGGLSFNEDHYPIFLLDSDGRLFGDQDNFKDSLAEFVLIPHHFQLVQYWANKAKTGLHHEFYLSGVSYLEATPEIWNGMGDFTMQKGDEIAPTMHFLGFNNNSNYRFIKDHLAAGPITASSGSGKAVGTQSKGKDQWVLTNNQYIKGAFGVTQALYAHPYPDGTIRILTLLPIEGGAVDWKLVDFQIVEPQNTISVTTETLTADVDKKPFPLFDNPSFVDAETYQLLSPLTTDQKNHLVENIYMRLNLIRLLKPIWENPESFFEDKRVVELAIAAFYLQQNGYKNFDGFVTSVQVFGLVPLSFRQGKVDLNRLKVGEFPVPIADFKTTTALFLAESSHIVGDTYWNLLHPAEDLGAIGFGSPPTFNLEGKFEPERVPRNLAFRIESNDKKFGYPQRAQIPWADYAEKAYWLQSEELKEKVYLAVVQKTIELGDGGTYYLDAIHSTFMDLDPTFNFTTLSQLKEFKQKNNIP